MCFRLHACVQACEGKCFLVATHGNNMVNTNFTQYMLKYNRFMDPVKEGIPDLC